MKAFKDIESIADRPKGYDGDQNGIVPASDLGKLLTDDHVVEAYKVPWEANGHLKNADENFNDAVWNVGEGRRDILQLKDIPEMGKGKGK